MFFRQRCRLHHSFRRWTAWTRCSCRETATCPRPTPGTLNNTSNHQWRGGGYQIQCLTADFITSAFPTVIITTDHPRRGNPLQTTNGSAADRHHLELFTAGPIAHQQDDHAARSCVQDRPGFHRPSIRRATSFLTDVITQTAAAPQCGRNAVADRPGQWADAQLRHEDRASIQCFPPWKDEIKQGSIGHSHHQHRRSTKMDMFGATTGIYTSTPATTPTRAWGEGRHRLS